MASKKAGRLAGLAALAGLAYMNKDKLFGAKDKTPDAAKSESKSKSYDRDTDTGVDAITSDAVKKPAVDLGEIRDEEGRLSTLRRNTETGETYDPIGSNPVKVASVSSPASKPAQTSRFAPVGSPVAKAAAGTGNAKAVVAPGGDRSARTDASSSGLGGVRRPGTNVNYEYAETSDWSLKKGGKVKKMASGGMTSSASKRADGIATKCKTRGRMC